MTVKDLAIELGLWDDINQHVRAFDAANAPKLLQQLAELPVKRSHATRRLGSYVSRDGQPHSIRLQFAQEPENLKQTLLHEIAHLCDHLTSPKATRRGHGPRWKAWATALGINVKSCGESEALAQLQQQRLKLVAVCQKCGAEFKRIRRLSRGRRYYHTECGGVLRRV
ncbi:MAG: SprT-like domain-containing protein [Desulfuromonadales bacterium]|nr:SprT-like domain-containing protein [Desulfuromonadales bacterium]